MAAITRKAKLGAKIDSSILDVLGRSSQPVSTLELASQVKYAWHAVQAHCLRLQIQGKIDGFKISNLNVWVILKSQKGKR